MGKARNTKGLKAQIKQWNPKTYDGLKSPDLTIKHKKVNLTHQSRLGPTQETQNKP